MADTDFDLFTIDASNPARPAKPAGDSFIDVVREYSWTLNERESREDVPYMLLWEYQITGGQLQQAANYWMKNLTLDAVSDVLNAALGNDLKEDAKNNPYQGLYRAEPTGFSYSLPYFDLKRRSLDNAWSDDTAFEQAMASVGQILTHSGFLKGALGTAQTVKAFGGAVIGGVRSTVPHMGAESPQVWQSTTRQAMNVQFDLLNTVSMEQTLKNYELVSLLSYQNTYYRRNIILAYPPVIYEYLIPGVKHMPCAIISNITVEDIGHKRRVDIPGSKLTNKILPDAFRITIQLTDLVAESRNILKGLFTTELVTSIETNANLAANAQQFQQQLGQAANLLGGAINNLLR
jgi:hypothetical protein